MPKFSLGQVVATPGALAALQEAPDSLWPYIQRHSNGNWGEVNAEDSADNPDALKVPPISEHGNVMEIAGMFGGAEKVKGSGEPITNTTV